MFSLRAIALLGITVYMLPTDPAQQQRFVEHATTAKQWVSTYCDRNLSTCDTADRIWADMKDKASFGFALAYDMATRRSSKDAGADHVRYGGATPAIYDDQPGLSAPRYGGTLTPDDLRPVWRGHPQP